MSLCAFVWEFNLLSLLRISFSFSLSLPMATNTGPLAHTDTLNNISKHWPHTTQTGDLQCYQTGLFQMGLFHQMNLKLVWCYSNNFWQVICHIHTHTHTHIMSTYIQFKVTSQFDSIQFISFHFISFRVTCFAWYSDNAQQHLARRRRSRTQTI